MSPADASARIRSVCGDVIAGIWDSNFNCGGEFEIHCDPDENNQNEPRCDAGLNSFRHDPFDRIYVNCPWPIPNEDFGVCYACGAHGEPSCGPDYFSSPPQPIPYCDSGLVVASTSGLSGTLEACGDLFPDIDLSGATSAIKAPGDPENRLYEDPDFDNALSTSDLPDPLDNIWEIVTDTKVCADAAPADLSGGGLDSWATEALSPPERGTVIVIHGRKSRCENVAEVLAVPSEDPLYGRNQLVYCLEYDQSGDPHGVRVVPVTQDSNGLGPDSCLGSDDCTFDVDHPVIEIDATDRSVEAIAAAAADAILAAPTEGEITLLPHSGGGFLARALVHRHYDRMRWRGKNIARVMSLGHPYYGVLIDPALATPWVCAKDDAGDRDHFVDCSVLRWLSGWDLGPQAIDDSDFPQIEWTAIAGDGLNAAGTSPAYPAQLGGLADGCAAVFGGVNRTSVSGDTVVPIQSSLGIDEHQFFTRPGLSFDDASSVRCDHDARCLVREALREDPNRIPAALFPRTITGSGSLAFDGNDQVAASDPVAVGALTLSTEMTLEAWVRPNEVNEAVSIVSKSGEYELGLSPIGGGRGELVWALGNVPGFTPVQTGFELPRYEWSHVALTWESGGTGVVVYVNGAVVDEDPGLAGTIGDAFPLENELRFGRSERRSAEQFLYAAGESLWSDQAGATVVLDMTAANLLLADEITTLPGPNEQLCGEPGNRQVACSLTWRASETGFCRDITLSVNEGLTFDDTEFSFSNALSIGDVDNGEDDDIDLTFSDETPLYAIGVTLLHNDVNESESTRIFDTADEFVAFSPVVPIGDSAFMGWTSSVPIGRVEIREDPGGDDIAIADIRMDCDGVGSGPGFSGRISDVRVWDRTLSQTEIVAGLGGDPGFGDQSGLVGWWRLDDPSGDMLLDSSANQFDLPFSEIPADNAPSRRTGLQVGIVDRALYFDGQNDYLAITDPTSLAELELVDQLTIEAWIFPRAGAVSNGAILNKEGEYALVRLSDGRMAWSLKNANPGWVTTASSYVAPTGVWTHVSFSYDSAAGFARLYVNGQFEEEWLATGVLGDHHAAEDELRIGARTISNQPFFGAIDDVRLWNVARTATEIEANYDQPLSPDTSGLLAHWAFDEEASGVAFDRASGYHAAFGGSVAGRMPVRIDSRSLTNKPVPEPGFLVSLLSGVVLITWVGRRSGPASASMR